MAKSQIVWLGLESGEVIGVFSTKRRALKWCDADEIYKIVIDDIQEEPDESDEDESEESSESDDDSDDSDDSDDE